MTEPILSEALRDAAVDEIAKDLKEHDLPVGKKDRKAHARDVLDARLKTIQKMHEQFEKMITEASIKTYDQPLRDGNRKQMVTVLQEYPGMKKKTAKDIVAQLYGS